jgi:signal transduction histidine kinase
VSGQVPGAPNRPEAPAEDREARLGEDARRIGHDLNNSIGVLLGRAELMRIHLERGDPDGVRKGIDVILAQVERMKELADELRSLRHRP